MIYTIVFSKAGIVHTVRSIAGEQTVLEYAMMRERQGYHVEVFAHPF